jgi:S-adenosylmethionine:tRNA ribosyltransferase-isomerase
MKTADFDFVLPPGLIAQEPLPDRTASRMLVMDRRSGALEHRFFRDLPEFLRPGDLLVLNDTRVIPARLHGRRAGSGGKVELLLLEEESPAIWQSYFRASTRAKAGDRLTLADGAIEAEVLELLGKGRLRIQLRSERPLSDVLQEKGAPPLPPYIRRMEPDLVRRTQDRDRYQTVYAREAGAVAAPTAGLHFTPELLDALEKRGIERVHVTLHVGPGTFKPVKADQVEDHAMDEERYEVSEPSAARIHAARAEGRRIVAVGTTSVRTLETMADRFGRAQACEGRTSVFIRPPHRFRLVDAMITNFHLPKSTLLMLVSAFAGGDEQEPLRGRDRVLEAYHQAIARAYRFYSYGDCMLIL